MRYAASCAGTACCTNREPFRSPAPDESLFRDGVPASRLQLPPGEWATLLDGLAAHFPGVGREAWADRFARGLVLDAHRVALRADARWRAGMEIRYWREVVDEPCIAGHETVLHADDHLVVADKPHGLPVMPTGRYAAETLLARLVRRLGNPHLVPLHRIDRDTAGIVLFSACADSRARYHALFRSRSVEKRYEALAPPLPALAFPLAHRSRLVRGEPFFRMAEAVGEPDSETRIDVIERGAAHWRYALQPVSGRKHQLRVHMAAIGAAILGDPLYPVLRTRDDAVLQLLARSIAFEDPLDGTPRRFESAMTLGT